MKQPPKIAIILFLISMFSLMPGTSKAQDAFNMRIEVYLYNKDTKDTIKSENVTWGYFPDIKDATNFKNKFEQYSDDILKFEELEKLKKTIRQFPGKSGRIKWSAARPGGVVIYTFDNRITIVHISKNHSHLKVERGDSVYVFKTDPPIEVVRKKEHVTTQTIKPKPLPKSDIVEDEFGDMMSVTLNIPIEKKDVKPSTRLIVQPYMEDCLTEDTMEYCSPIVFDAIEYHGLQDKRMSFDFKKNDLLSMGYIEEDSISVLPTDKDTVLTVTVTYQKPNKKRDYRVPYKLSYEDYHHPYKSGSFRGTCLRKRPFKFMDFSVATADFNLETDDNKTEFFEDQLPAFIEKNEALDLRFEEKAGSSTLLRDSANEAQLEKLTKILKDFGPDLIADQSAIIAYASAEGTEESNRRVVSNRSQVAVALINQRLPRNKQLKAEHHIYTWEETATSLERKKYFDEAKAIRDIIANEHRKSEQDRQISNLSTYNDIIIPELNSQRKMGCRYKYAASHIMEAEECVSKYYDDKYFNFSNGDYYKLFTTLTDSTELDELTRIAYEKYVNMENYEREKFAPYVINRKAIIDIKRAHPDTLTLRVLIDTTKTINVRQYYGAEDYFIVNHEEYIINQTIAYFMSGRLTMADKLLKMLEEKIDALKNPDNKTRVTKLRQYINFRRYHFGHQDMPEYATAKSYIVGPYDEQGSNKAILYTEVDEWGQQDIAEQYIDAMDDNDPRKWYLKGILYVKNAGKDDYKELEQYMTEDEASPEKDVDDTAAEVNNAEQENSSIPFYLAYFQGCFDIDPSYKKYYYNEGHVPDELRKKYKYKIAKKDQYRRVFKYLKIRDRNQSLTNLNVE